MHVTEVYRLRTGSPVWIWVVQLAKGRWWPGVVDGIRAIDHRPRIVVRFECRVARGRQYHPTVRAGVATTAMRYLEQRDPDFNGIDVPHFVPVSLLELPEEHEGRVPQRNVLSMQRPRKENVHRASEAGRFLR